MSNGPSSGDTLISGFRVYRKKNHMTQIDLAEAMGVTQTSVSQWESGRNYPDIKTARRLADYFSTSLDNVLSQRSLEEFEDADRFSLRPGDYIDNAETSEEQVQILEQKRLLLRIFEVLSPTARQRVLDRAEAYFEVEQLSAQEDLK
ncbi:MAG: helix-turn-helix domain-containing protein [Clostridiaceae bacterium]|nr:helix-turn-helix domain-containing protein [Clostridiaceae bacterium]